MRRKTQRSIQRDRFREDANEASGLAVRRLVVGCHGVVALGHAGRGAVPEQADHLDHRFRAGRPERRDGAHPHQEDGGDPQAAGGGREPRRRRRRDRRHRGHQGRARRLHHPACDRLVARDQRQPLQEPRLRPGEGFRPDLPDRHPDQSALRPSGLGSGEDAEGVRGLREGQSRQAHLRLGRHRHAGASRGRIAQGRGEDRDDARAVPRHRPGAAKRDRRPRAGRVQSAVAALAASAERFAARDRRDHA